ncbi:MAG: hypothetical protein R3F39_24035 [Myxococcota bacterium]
MTHAPPFESPSSFWPAAAALLLAAALCACATDDTAAPQPAGDASPDAAAPLACSPGARLCIDERTSAVCGPDGALGPTPLDCPDGLRCDPGSGVCRLPFCEPGTYSCADPDHLRRCGQDGDGYEPDLERCLNGRTCNGGRCTVCIPGALTCTTDRELSRCRPDGARWDRVLTCGSDTLCHSPSASCISNQCDGDSILCVSPNAYRVCRGPETGWSDAVFACNLQEICNGGACVPCADGPTRCSETGQLEICDAAVGGYKAQACPAMSACSGHPAACGVPAPPFCLAGEYDCADGSARALCNAHGNGWEPGLSFCAMGQRCSFGACIPAGPARRVMLVVDGSVRVGPDWAALFAGIWHSVSNSPFDEFGLTIFPSHIQPLSPPSFPQLPLGHLNGTSILAAVFAANPPAGMAPLIETVERLGDDDALFLGEPGVTVIVVLAGDPVCETGEPDCAARLERATRILHEVRDATVHAIVWRSSDARPWAEIISEAGSEAVDGGGPKTPPLAVDAASLAAAITAILTTAPGSAELAPP